MFQMAMFIVLSRREGGILDASMRWRRATRPCAMSGGTLPWCISLPRAGARVLRENVRAFVPALLYHRLPRGRSIIFAEQEHCLRARCADSDARARINVEIRAAAG